MRWSDITDIRNDGTRGGRELDRRKGWRTHMILKKAAVKPNHIYRLVFHPNNKEGEGGHTAGPRLASVPPNSNALWAILHPYIDITHARETRSVESHFSLVSDRRKGARDPLSKVLGAEKEWMWEIRERDGKENKGEEEEGADSRCKKERIGYFRYTSMPLIDGRTIVGEWRW
jgi:hypothetical protein